MAYHKLLRTKDVWNQLWYQFLELKHKNHNSDGVSCGESRLSDLVSYHRYMERDREREISNSLCEEPPPCQQSTVMSLFVSDSCFVATEQQRTDTSHPMEQLFHCRVTCLRCDIRIQLFKTGTSIPNLMVAKCQQALLSIRDRAEHQPAHS